MLDRLTAYAVGHRDPWIMSGATLGAGALAIAVAFFGALYLVG